MKQILIVIIFFCIVMGESKNWETHSAYLLPKKHWEIGLFQPFRYGYSDKIEYSTHPFLFFIIPNFSVKKSYTSITKFTVASRYKIFYPTFLLNMVAKEGILGFIPPEHTLPPMLGFSTSWILSKNIMGLNTTVTSGFDIGFVFGTLDKRTTIDLPLFYHRLGIFYNQYGLHFGLDIQKNIIKKLSVLVDLDLKYLPGFDGDYSLEHKMLIRWKKSDRFHILTGYKFVLGDYPFGTEMRILPYIPVLEKWVPIIEFQWSGQKK